MEEMTTYLKEEIKTSEKFKKYRDCVEALLEEGKYYTIEEAEEIIKSFLKGEV